MGFLHSHSKINVWAKAFKNGDESAAEHIFTYFYPAIFRYIRSRVRDIDTSSDIAQNVFLKVARTIRLYDPEKGDFTAWVWQIVRNTLIDHYRTAARNQADSETALDTAIDDFAGNDTDYTVRDDLNRVLALIKTYSKDDQELFRLRYIAELSYEEISKLTGRTVNSLRVALHRIRDNIRNDYDR